MMMRITSVMIQLTLLVSALAGKPAALNAACHFGPSKPSTLVLLMERLTCCPGVFCLVNDTPSLVTKSCARSHAVKFDQGPTKMWKLQVLASADTVTVLFFWNASRSGLTKWVSAPNSGK